MELFELLLASIQDVFPQMELVRGTIHHFAISLFVQEVTKFIKFIFEMMMMMKMKMTMNMKVMMIMTRTLTQFDEYLISLSQ